VLDEAGWFETGHDIEGWIIGVDGFERPQSTACAEAERVHLGAGSVGRGSGNCGATESIVMSHFRLPLPLHQPLNE
jgi:hypothetical protein